MTYHRQAISLLIAMLMSSTTAVAAEPADLIRRLSASTIIAISDGDFVGQTYASGRLAPREAGYRDLLSVLSIADGKLVTGTLPISNSVTSAPEILTLSADGNTAFATERLGERNEMAETVRDLPPGNRLFAVDLSNKSQPRLVDTVEIAAFPEALGLDPTQPRVAVVSNTSDGSFVQIVRYHDGQFGNVVRFNLAGLGVSATSDGPRGGITATNVHWHPSGRYLAVNINTQNRVAFFEVTGTLEQPSLKLWGNIVDVGSDPFVGRFSPDGRYYFTSDWGRNFAATNLEGRVPDRPSAISVIRLAEPGATEARHTRVTSVGTDVAAEGISVSPDGTLIATVNMRGTAFSVDSARFQREGTVTLLSFNGATGQLTKIADYPFEGVLPEGGVFDRTGDHFLATVFQGHEEAGSDQGAGLQVFQVVKGEKPALKSLGRIPLPHGVHHVDLANAR
ncbi:hypothetical protein [Brucella sp. IR073]|uniref:hypothetical protein n=1 Tax=unclassified Brucella TaxID=2632610 RepID=UPI003B986840